MQSDTHTAYRRIVARIRKIAGAELPRNSNVVVVSKGDPALMKLPGRTAWHFPRQHDGTYAGYYPENSLSAIAHLEALRAEGADYLVFPATAFWWRDKYAEFYRHLERRYHQAVVTNACVIFALRQPATWFPLHEAIGECRTHRLDEPAILDCTAGRDIATAFPECRVFLPPESGRSLPYLDRSIDIVAVNARDKAAVKEAHRVASWAVVEFRDRRSGGFELKAVPIVKKRRAAPLGPSEIISKVRAQAGAKKALVCSYHIVQPDRDSGSRRVFHFLTFLLEAGWDVTFLAADGIGDVCDAQRLQQMGIAVYDGQTDKIEELFSKSAFDVAVIAFWRNAERYIPALRRLSPATRIIVDSIDLHFVREIRQAFIGADEGRLLDRNTDVALAGELNAYAAADGILAVSDKETVLLNDLLGNRTCAYTVPDYEDLVDSNLPFDKRRGIVCIGSFQHPPNVQAVRYLCQSILPLIDPALLKKHPVRIIGNALNDNVRSFAEGLPHVRMIGWVPSIEPYLEHARVSVVPLLVGAGTKRKLMHALAAGTPSVSTSIGVEGFELRHGSHVLVSDTAAYFAASITRLLKNRQLWERLSRRGRAYAARTHSRNDARGLFQIVIETVCRNQPKAAAQPPEELIPHIRRVATLAIPSGSTVLVVSKGDNELLQLDGHRAWHFPQTTGGVYAGCHPKDSADAIQHLAELRTKGAEYLLFPKTAFWWLDHYAELKNELESRFTLICRDEACVIYGLTASADPALAPAGSRLTPSRRWAATRPVRLIAFYLPQFHPIPENDEWWGEGFTEWRNVAKADPQFLGHYQPHVPADLGFYDLRLAETREQQAAMARSYGIHGFCYYHYWFNGRRLLERPFAEVLASGKPDFPFCLCWANDPWSRRWDGRDDELLQAQSYSDDDDLRHIEALIPALSDPRAITVEGKPVFLVYRGKHLPNAARTTRLWRKRVRAAGLPGIHLVAMETAWDLGWDATAAGFDAKVLFQPQFGRLITHGSRNGARHSIPGKDRLQVYDYRAAAECMHRIEPVSYRRYETVVPNWDNTARVGENAVVLHESSPEVYEQWLRRAVDRARRNPSDHRLVFLNAWNEWAEGCHLEPDLRYGHAYLEATARALQPTAEPVQEVGQTAAAAVAQTAAAVHDRRRD